jgi:DNA-binding NtrC family response regulator
MPGRILVVDDDESIRELVAEILLDAGHEVVQARNGAHAFGHIQQGTEFDLVVLDMRMPVVDGWQFASGLAELGLALPIVVMTAAQNARRWAEEIGAAGYIAKPFGIDELLSAIENVIDPEDKPTLESDSPIRWLVELLRTLDRPRRPVVVS